MNFSHTSIRSGFLRIFLVLLVSYMARLTSELIANGLVSCHRWIQDFEKGSEEAMTGAAGVVTPFPHQPCISRLPPPLFSPWAPHPFILSLPCLTASPFPSYSLLYLLYLSLWVQEGDIHLLQPLSWLLLPYSSQCCVELLLGSWADGHGDMGQQQQQRQAGSPSILLLLLLGLWVTPGREPGRVGEPAYCHCCHCTWLSLAPCSLSLTKMGVVLGLPSASDQLGGRWVSLSFLY